MNRLFFFLSHSQKIKTRCHLHSKQRQTLVLLAELPVTSGVIGSSASNTRALEIVAKRLWLFVSSYLTSYLHDANC